MIKKVVNKTDFKKEDSIKEDLKYWLEKEPGERISAVDFLRMQANGNSERLQRIARVIQRS
ncbi:MAG: hypothetical protein GX654_10905 [Desulfatiglans sp.]|jgi:hypothetical protein|nr:hypothetical protein [Desulfatiglans sp.]